MPTPADIASKPAFARNPFISNGYVYSQPGLTFRELAAIELTKAVIIGGHASSVLDSDLSSGTEARHRVCRLGVSMADTLAAELSKTPSSAP